MTPAHRPPSQGSHYLELTCARDGKLTAWGVTRIRSSCNNTNWRCCRKVFIFRQTTYHPDRFGPSQELGDRMTCYCKQNVYLFWQIKAWRDTVWTHIRLMLRYMLSVYTHVCVCARVCLYVWLCLCFCPCIDFWHTEIKGIGWFNDLSRLIALFVLTFNDI